MLSGQLDHAFGAFLNNSGLNQGRYEEGKLKEDCESRSK